MADADLDEVSLLIRRPVRSTTDSVRSARHVSNSCNKRKAVVGVVGEKEVTADRKSNRSKAFQPCRSILE